MGCAGSATAPPSFVGFMRSLSHRLRHPRPLGLAPVIPLHVRSATAAEREDRFQDFYEAGIQARGRHLFQATTTAHTSPAQPAVAVAARECVAVKVPPTAAITELTARTIF